MQYTVCNGNATENIEASTPKEAMEKFVELHPLERFNAVSIEQVDVYLVVFDSTSPYWQPNREMNTIFLRLQEQRHNARLAVNGYVFLNEILEDLGIKRIPAGQIVGWFRDDEKYIEFSMVEADEAIQITFKTDGPIYEEI